MGNKVFVGGLSWNVDDEMLTNEFQKYGEVKHCKVVTDRETGKSRGFGFVTFNDSKDAEDAMIAMDGRELDGRTIRVSEAKENPQRRNFG